MKILAIDVGLLNLALIGVDLPENYLERQEVILEKEIFFCELIDITQLIIECNDPNCKLYHDKIICDYMTHLFKKYKNIFESANEILVERQPPFGIVAVQELIMREYRNKCQLISPNAMLKFFGILQFEYPERKVLTEKIAMEYLSSIKIFVFNERRHDMADSLCLILYYLSIKRKEYIKKIEEEKNKIKFNKICLDLEKFKYNPDDL
jgi:hypothetical protein